MSQQPLPTQQAVAEEYWSSLIEYRLGIQNGRAVITGCSLQRPVSYSEGIAVMK